MENKYHIGTHLYDLISLSFRILSKPIFIFIYCKYYRDVLESRFINVFFFKNVLYLHPSKTSICVELKFLSIQFLEFIVSVLYSNFDPGPFDEEKKLTIHQFKQFYETGKKETHTHTHLYRYIHCISQRYKIELNDTINI